MSEDPRIARYKSKAKRARAIQKVRDRCEDVNTTPAERQDDDIPAQPRPARKFPERRPTN